MYDHGWFYELCSNCNKIHEGVCKEVMSFNHDNKGEQKRYRETFLIWSKNFVDKYNNYVQMTQELKDLETTISVEFKDVLQKGLDNVLSDMSKFINQVPNEPPIVRGY